MLRATTSIYVIRNILSDDSDLNLNINKENFLKAVPVYEHGFMYMWAGARGTYGFSAGKIYYDVKVCFCMFDFIYLFIFH